MGSGSDGKESTCNAGNPGSIPEQEDSLEKRMATHSRILAEEFHGQGSLAGYSPWGCKESDMTEQLAWSLSTSVGRSIGKKVNRLSFQ